jgi:hypothetical protein
MYSKLNVKGWGSLVGPSHFIQTDQIRSNSMESMFTVNYGGLIKKYAQNFPSTDGVSSFFRVATYFYTTISIYGQFIGNINIALNRIYEFSAS